MADTIWFVFSKQDGSFLGSGTPYHDDETVGSTAIEAPEYNHLTERLTFTGSEWVVTEIPVVSDETEQTEETA